MVTSYRNSRVFGTALNVSAPWRQILAGYKFLTYAKGPIPYVLFREKGGSVERRLHIGKTQPINPALAYEYKTRATEIGSSAWENDFFLTGSAIVTYEDDFEILASNEPIFVTPEILFATEATYPLSAGGTYGTFTVNPARKVVVSYNNIGATAVTVDSYSAMGGSAFVTLSTALAAGTQTIHVWGQDAIASATQSPEVPRQLSLGYVSVAAHTIQIVVKMFL